MKMIMPNMRDGILSTEEGNTLNSCVINDNEVKKPNPLKSSMPHTATRRDRISTQVSFEII
jgi:hypothetical protein